ncbi:helix-turn-helix domain-containing protein [Curtobacterium sp. VKM Ac-2922]|uniref:AraC family transcriptional regulator n=1 Tax=Curtobacterium sp. VKM Ac-2922 TaxID=2929475 RepID=UPI001FB30034|nr:helix-turn-helix domain-containing protein [Curtobacterium sp. VKM Ac-2922]MCJ1714357.1 helix-turn-helix domain-containing protein [Curtobacterium sp. VKM Ac-2922]
MNETTSRPPTTALVAVSGQDTDSAITSLAGMYAGRTWYSSALDQQYWYKYVAVGDDQLSVRRSQMHGYLRGDVATEGEVVVQWLDRGTARVDVGRDEVRMEPGVPTLFPVERRFRMEYQDWDQRLVHLGQDLVRQVAEESGLLAGGPLAFDHRVTPDPTSIAVWRTAVAGAMRALHTGGVGSLAWHEAQREVARALLRLYPLQSEPLGADPAQRAGARLRTAIEYLEAHAHEAVTVTAIADAAGLSVRGLQDSFQRTLDQSPMAYLREMRLRRAQEDLLLLDPGESSVAEVARRWGFTHMGRFSAEYASRFGEYPRHTLRRSS